MSSRRGSEAYGQDHPTAEDRARTTNGSTTSNQLDGVDSKLEALSIQPQLDQPTTHVEVQPSPTISTTSAGPSGSATPTRSRHSDSPNPATRSLAQRDNSQDGTSTPPRSSRPHGRSHSMASPPTSRSAEAGAGAPSSRTRERDPNSTSSSRRDREREGQTNGRSSGRDGASSSSTREQGGGSSSSRSRRVLGEWTMTKTLGAGSMGKVKLAVSSVTGEKVSSSYEG